MRLIVIDPKQAQHHALPSLRKRAPDPEVDLHSEAARVRGIANDDWLCVETPEASVRARARINDRLDPRVAVGTHGWWQAWKQVEQESDHRAEIVDQSRPTDQPLGPRMRFWPTTASRHTGF